MCDFVSVEIYLLHHTCMYLFITVVCLAVMHFFCDHTGTSGDSVTVQWITSSGLWVCTSLSSGVCSVYV